MWPYVVRRLGICAVVLFLISILDFLVINLAPGDPLQAMLPPESGTSVTGRLYQEYGLGGSIPVRYLRWLGSVVHGQFGTSYETHTPAFALIVDRLPNTLLLTGSALALALVAGIVIGVTSGLHEGSSFDHAAGVATFVTFSVPQFFLALLAIFVGAIVLGWFPAGGMYAPVGTPSPGDLVWHLALPAAVLAIVQVPHFVRYVRASVMEILHREYVRAARGRGLRRRTVVWVHIVPNALAPLISLVGLSLPGLVGGAYLVEFVFGWPGLGVLSIQAATFRDYPVFMGTALLIAVGVLLSNLIADVAYAVVDPRVRYD